MDNSRFAWMWVVAAALSAMPHIAAGADPAPTGELPDSKPDPQQEGYENVMDCVRAAFKQAISQSDTFEEGGMIYKMDGKYFFTLPVTQGQYDSVHYTPWKPDRATKVALYHTHPGRYSAAERFSQADIDFAKKVDMTMFVAVVRNNQIIVQRPTAQFPLYPSAEPPINAQVTEMLKTSNPMEVAKKLMVTGTPWEAARMQVNEVLAARAHADEQKKLIAMLSR